MLAEPSVTARRLARVLKLEEKDVLAKLASDGDFVYLARQVDDDVAERVADLDIPGVLIIDEPARFGRRATWRGRCSAASTSTTPACPGSSCATTTS